MKYILYTLLFFSATAQAQTDSSRLTITVRLPVKAIVMYAHYKSQTFDWADRRMPDILAPLIGSGSKPDSLTDVTTTAGELYTFIQRVQGEQYGIISPVARSIFNNSPAITGYTALFTQIVNKANGNTSEKGAAQWMVNRYQEWEAMQTGSFNHYYNRALSLITN